MRCEVIVLINLSTNDSKVELDENRKSLLRKYEARGQTCHLVDFPSGRIPKLNGKGTVGVYVLSHTKDVVASELARQLFDQLIAIGADVRKISIACYRAASGEGPMKPFCMELLKCQTDKVKLPQGLMICGFTVNVTTFDNESPFMDKEGEKFQNFPEIKEKAAQTNRGVATVKQAWAPVGSGEPNFMSFVHEKMGVGATPAFILEAEKLFRECLVEEWRVDRSSFITTKYNPSVKSSMRILDTTHLEWSDFRGIDQAAAKRYIKSTFWSKFIARIKGVNLRSAAMWSSLDAYVKMKSVMKFNGKDFHVVALSEYAENEDMKQALRFVENAEAGKGLTLRFLPEF